MIFFIIHYFEKHLGIQVPAAFEYTSTRMMLAAITSLLLSIFIGPSFIKKLYELKIGQSIRTDECPLLGQLHHKKKDTPTMGGALILFSMLVSMLVWMHLKHVFTLLLFITTLVLGFLGARDDYLKLKYKNAKGLSGRKKILVQGILSAIIALYLISPAFSGMLQMGTWFQPPVVKEVVHYGGHHAASKPALSHAIPKMGEGLGSGVSDVPGHTVSTLPTGEYAQRIYIPFLKEPWVIFTGIFVVVAVVFMMCVIIGSSNAVNLTDGLDGLAAGSLIMVASCLAIIAFISNNLDLAGYLNILYIEGSGEIAVYLSAFAGACLGFLWYNGHPAQVFMGDTGSLALGGVLGVAAVLLKREFLLAIIGGIFVAEALSVILQVASYKLRDKKRIFLCAPLHHHFEYKGWPETKVVIRFWIIGLLLAIIGMASLKFQ